MIKLATLFVLQENPQNPRVFSRCFSKAPSKVRCSSRNERLRRSGRLTKRDARKIAVSQNVLAVLAVLFFHTCSTSGDQECVEI
jgi:hypothetical protein